MKFHLLTGLAVAALAAPLAAQLPPGPPPQTRAEIAQLMAERFAFSDADHDGFLTADELGERGPAMIARMDADQDGKVSLAEATEGELARFDRIDSDHDGTISDAERAAARAAMGAPSSAEPEAEDD